MPFPVDQKYVRTTEEKIGADFPPSYASSMCDYNGGSVQTSTDEWNLYPIFDTSDKKRLKRTCNDVIRETNSARDWPNYPTGAVAIASNGTGDRLIFVRNDDRLGPQVHWWDHETGNTKVVAEDFSDLTKLQ